jgi:hypothetical protein
MSEAQNYHEWSACEWAGHLYVPDEDNPKRKSCAECGDSYEDE